MFPTDSGEIKRTIKKVFLQLVRLIGNQNSPASMDGKNVTEKPPQSNAIITGEFPDGLGSDAARCVIVELNAKVLDERLYKFQRKPLIVSTFYYFFIQWFVAEYDDIKGLLENWLDDFRKMDLGVNSHLQDTYFCFDTAYKFFLLYCVEKEFATPEDARAEHNYFQKFLLELVKKQDGRVKQSKDSEPETADLYELIRMLHKKETFDLAKDIKRFKNHDGLLHEGLLCLRSENLMKHIHKIAPTATLADVRQSLIVKDALWLDGEGKNKKVGQRRFISIPLKKLR